MSDGFQIKDQSAIYFLTFQIVAWVDVFTRRRYKDLIVQNLNYCINNKGLIVHGWCIMSNHIHAILSAKNGNLSSIVRDFKSYTSKQMLKSIEAEPESRREWMLFQFKRAAQQHNRNDHYQVWTHENHAVELTTNEMMDVRLNYIHQNPVRAGSADFAEHYPYSSAKDYSDEEGLIKIDLL